MAPIKIVVDTREQLPYSFDSARFEVLRHALPAGDYSIHGHETAVAVERKSLDDFASSVIRNRKRFSKELRILSGYEASCVVVEAELRDVLEWRYRGNAHPQAILGAAVSIIVDMNVPVFFCSDRQAACRFVERYLLRFHRKLAPT